MSALSIAVPESVLGEKSLSVLICRREWPLRSLIRNSLKDRTPEDNDLTHYDVGIFLAMSTAIYSFNYWSLESQTTALMSDAAGYTTADTFAHPRVL